MANLVDSEGNLSKAEVYRLLRRSGHSWSYNLDTLRPSDVLEVCSIFETYLKRKIWKPLDRDPLASGTYPRYLLKRFEAIERRFESLGASVKVASGSAEFVPEVRADGRSGYHSNLAQKRIRLLCRGGTARKEARIPFFWLRDVAYQEFQMPKRKIVLDIFEDVDPDGDAVLTQYKDAEDVKCVSYMDLPKSTWKSPVMRTGYAVKHLGVWAIQPTVRGAYLSASKEWADVFS